MKTKGNSFALRTIVLLREPNEILLLLIEKLQAESRHIHEAQLRCCYLQMFDFIALVKFLEISSSSFTTFELESNKYVLNC